MGVDVDQFAKIARRREWIEQDQVDFSIDVDGAVIQEEHAFELLSAPRAAGDAMIFILRWKRGDTLRDLDADFYRLYGRFAEDGQYVQRTISAPEVVYSVVVGDEDHGHRATFRIGGKNTATMVEAYEKTRVANRGSSRITESPRGFD